MSAEPSSSIQAAEPVVVSVAPSKNGRTPGKAHKSAKTALRRSYISPSVKTPFEKRMEKEKAQQAAKQLERELKEEKETDRQRFVCLISRIAAVLTKLSKVNIIKERRARKEEKQREEELRAKMSAKKLQRMKKVSIVRMPCIAIQLMEMCRGKADQRRSMDDLDYCYFHILGLYTRTVPVHYAYDDTCIQQYHMRPALKRQLCVLQLGMCRSRPL